MEYCIEVKNAFKTFKETTALDGVNLSFEKGGIHGIVGRNGSGKTVLFKCICGFMRLNSGEILINGKKVKPAAAQDVGVIIDTPGFIDSMSGYKNLKLLASINKKVSDETIKETLLKVGLDPENKKHVRKYSMGMRQRLGIAQAIMEDPEILVLDEPTNGLDNSGVEDIRTLFLSLKEKGKTILLASHNKEDISILCDTVHEMDHGKVIS